MAFYGYNGQVDNAYSIPYNSYNFDPTPVEFSSPSVDYNNFSATPLELNYSAYTYTEPNILHHTPYDYHESYINSSLSYNQHQFHSPTKFTISYSVSPVEEFNEPNFDEYDPTPYGGGYDPVTTYGKPLPPSDKICFPRSVPLSNPIAASSADKQKDEIEIPLKRIEAKPDKQKDEIEIPLKRIEAKPDKQKDEIEVPLKPIEAKSAEPVIPNDEGDRYGSYGMGERQTGRIPYGSGLESMDLCETLFGYWPCVAKREREERLREESEGERRRRRDDGADDPWNVAADYLFGGPVVSGYETYPQLCTLDQQSQFF